MVIKEKESSPPSNECGSGLKSHYAFAPDYLNLNHGSFGAIPKAIIRDLREHQDAVEARPDAFIRYDYPKALDVSRAGVADLLNVPVDTCVFVPNATTGVNTVLRALTYQPGDVIIYFDTIYGACEKTVGYLVETTPVESHKIEYTYPVTDDFLCSAFESAVDQIKRAGKNPRLAIFDTICSLPGVRVPFERLTVLCHQHKVLSLIDGAHGIGHIPLDLKHLDPDFFTSNCHKWLSVPRGCAVFYVPVRNQHLIRSTLPTSHGFVPVPREGVVITNPLPLSTKSAFVNNFEFVGTIDNSSYLCVTAAIAYRKSITYNGLSGEQAIIAYTQAQARDAGKLVADLLGTEILENEQGTLGNCYFSNVKLPLDYATVAGGEYAKALDVARWLAKTLVEEYGTFIAVIVHGEAWWVRLSAQVYLDLNDWKKGGEILRDVCGRIREMKWT